MTFPWHSRSWQEAGEFLSNAVHADERILAPDAFWWVVGRVERYVPPNLTSDTLYDWVVLKVDDMPQIPRGFLRGVAARMAPAFVNDTFVIWAGGAGPSPGADIDLRDRLAGFWVRLAQLGPEPSEPNRYVLDAALSDASHIVNHATLSDAEIKVSMNDLFRRTGYLYPTLRDQGYLADMRAHTAGLVDRCRGGAVLDVCSGGLRFVDAPVGTRVVRTDLSEVGLELARQADERRPGITYAVMDAQRIAAAEMRFDAVLFMDAIEHVRDASLVLREAARMLVPGGWLLLSFSNTGSVNQVIAEKLGHPRFVTNHQHFREFSLEEITGLLHDSGLDVRETAGINLYPYWGVPRLDDVVRPVTDDDPEVVEMMRELGRRVGAEYAYTGVVIAQRSI
jgi:2-polyprenyl-3-methyl-5-hydroxy-6-metoxy-1,4-benzoquinol methylase